MFDLGGKNALVTGASGGIGGAVARALHAQGANVALSGRRADVLAELAGQLGQRSHVVASDLAAPEAIVNLVKDAEAAMGSIDILVNNAGITRDGLSIRMSDQDWASVMDINLTTAFRLSRGCLKGMIKRRWGRIVSITSIVGITGNPGQANYAASKAGMVAMSKSMAQEVATRGVTLNCVAPGFIATPMTDQLSDDQKKRLISNIPSRRLGNVDDIAAAVAFLATDEASYITGQTMHVNGGMAMI